MVDKWIESNLKVVNVIIFILSFVAVYTFPISFSAKNQAIQGGCEGKGDSSCEYAVVSRIEGTGNRIYVIEHIGEGLFQGILLDGTYLEKKQFRIQTDCDCEIIDVNIR